MVERIVFHTINCVLKVAASKTTLWNFRQFGEGKHAMYLSSVPRLAS